MIQPEDIIVEGDDLSISQSQIAVSKIPHTPQRGIPENLCFHISPENPYHPRKRSPALKQIYLSSQADRIVTAGKHLTNVS